MGWKENQEWFCPLKLAPAGFESSGGVENKKQGEKMKKFTSLALCALTLGATSAFAASDSIEDAFKNGTYTANVGMHFSLKESEVDAPDSGLATGFLEFNYESDSFRGFKVGADMFGLTEIWEDEDDNWDSTYDEKAFLRELWLSYTCGETTLTLGRKQLSFPDLDGDSHEGISLETKALENVTLRLAAFNKWINDADWDDDGINAGGFLEVKDALRDEYGYDQSVGAFVYLAAAEFDAVPGMLALTPFAYYQADVAQVFGFEAVLSHETEGFNASLTFDYYKILEDLDVPVSTEDMDYFKICAAVESNGLRGAIGYSKCSDVDDVAITDESWLGDLGDFEYHGPLGDDVQLMWFTVGYTYDKFSLDFFAGKKTQDDPAGEDWDMSEWSLTASYALKENLTLGAFYADVTDKDDNGSEDNSYDLLEATVVYSF
jgi:hypothetical protein